MSVTRFVGRQAGAIALAAAVGSGHTVLSADGYRDLGISEGFVLEPYTDIAGVRTVCAGETQGIENRTYTVDECGELLVRRVEEDFVPRIVACTDDRIWDGLGQETKDALVEFSWNVGTGAYCRGSVAKRLNAGRGVEACERILLYDKARINGKLKPVDGLTKRREREAAKCRAGFDAVTAERIERPRLRFWGIFG